MHNVALRLRRWAGNRPGRAQLQRQPGQGSWWEECWSVSPDMCWAASLLAHTTGQGSGSPAAWRQGMWAGKATPQKAGKERRDPRPCGLSGSTCPAGHMCHKGQTLIHRTPDEGR